MGRTPNIAPNIGRIVASWRSGPGAWMGCSIARLSSWRVGGGGAGGLAGGGGLLVVVGRAGAGGVRRLEGMAAVVALAYRTGEPGASDVVDELVSDRLARVVQPRPLSDAALAGMLGSELGEEVDPGFCAACREATGGNPLLVTELL